VVANYFLLSNNWSRISRFPVDITPFSFSVIGLATYRIANIVANEQVTKVFRAPFINVKKEPDDSEEEIPKPTGIKGTIGTLLYCPSCVGVWVATMFAYLLLLETNVAWFIAIAFALSAMERIFTESISLIAKKSES
jgi:hypothetical protein